MTWWERLARIMSDKGVSPDDLATRAGVPLKSVYGYLNGDVQNPRGDTLAKLAEGLGLSEAELRFGANIPTPVALKRIPLLVMDKIGQIKPAQAPLDAWDGVSVVHAPETVSDQAFAVTVDDAANEPHIPKGAVIICDPAQPVDPGRFVLAVLTSERRAVVGRFRPMAYRDQSRYALRLANDDYPDIDVTLDAPARLIARAVKLIRDL